MKRETISRKKLTQGKKDDGQKQGSRKQQRGGSSRREREESRGRWGGLSANLIGGLYYKMGGKNRQEGRKNRFIE